MQGTPEAGPKIEYDPRINWAKQRFNINVNQVGCAALFSHIGMSQDAIQRKTVLISSHTPVSARYPEKVVASGYDAGRETILLFVKNVWGVHDKSLNRIIEYAGLQYSKSIGFQVKEHLVQPYEQKARDLLRDADDLDKLLATAEVSPNHFVQNANIIIGQMTNYRINLAVVQAALVAVDKDPEQLPEETEWRHIVTFIPHPVDVEFALKIKSQGGPTPKFPPPDFLPDPN